MSPAGVAIIGSGIFVKEEHLPAVLECKDLTLRAIYSRSLKSAEGVTADLKDKVDLYSDDSSQSYDDLLKRSDIHSVIIALPIPIQSEFIKRALEAGKHVLAEKPLAKDLATATELLKWYHSGAVDTSKVTFGIAEQFRYLESFQFAADTARSWGKVLGFRLKLGAMIPEGQKYLETPWRKKPEFQGGFLLDGGVHFVAGMRMMLGGKEGKVSRVCAFTVQQSPHMLPLDTVDGIMRLENGSTGNFSASFGTTFKGAEWAVACEGGSISVDGDKVTLSPRDGEEKVEVKKTMGGGVKEEVWAWAKGVVDGKPEARQRPEEALADLEILESLLKSGEHGGQAVDLKYQEV